MSTPSAVFSNVPIYTFYRDLLYNFASLIDNSLGNIFRKIEYNISSRTLLYKNFDGSLKLPALLLSVQPMKRKFYNVITSNNFMTMRNIDALPILINETKNNIIGVKVEYMEIPIMLNINAETQLAALEIQQYLSAVFPENVKLKWDGFKTLIPIDDSYLESYDFVNDEIYYVYQTTDNITGATKYFGIYTVEPFITNTSTDTSVSSLETSLQTQVMFNIEAFVPSIMFSYNAPDIIQKIVIAYSLSDELPVIQETFDTYTYDTKSFSYRKGYIIDNTYITTINDTEEYLEILIPEVPIISDFENNTILKIILPDSTDIASYNAGFNLILYDSENNAATYRVDFDLFGSFKDDFISGNIKLETVLLSSI